MLSMLLSALSGPVAGMIAKRLGVSEATVQKAIAVALPVLISALARNASTPKGAESLAGALAKDHDGSLLDDVLGYVSGGVTDDGSKILGHVLGDQRGKAEAGISQAAGLDAQSTAQLMEMLAPVVLAYLGKQQSTAQLEPGDLGDLLKQEKANATADSSTDLGGLTDMFDANRDGSVTDDAARFGFGMLRKWLSGRH
jgi:hypothetical protein